MRHPSGRLVRVLVVDVGLKYNQLRCLVSRGVEVEVVPWDYDFPQLAGKEYDGLFISNGPGDPAMMQQTVKNIQKAMEEARVPIFGLYGRDVMLLGIGIRSPSEVTVRSKHMKTIGQVPMKSKR